MATARANKKETPEQELARLRKENEQLRQQGEREFEMRVAEKGGVSVYGLGRFPVTLYQEQWFKLLDHAEEIAEFIEEHKSELKSRGQR